MTLIGWMAIGVACAGPAGPPAGGGRPPVLVAAAVSLTEAVEAVAARFETATGDMVDLNLGASNTLATQIIAGAPVDLFISADARQMDRVDAAGQVDRASRVDLLSNRLVAVTRREGPVRVGAARDLAGASVRRIAIGDPDGVPAGVYAKAFLVAEGVWEALQPRLVPVRSVRAVLAAVDSGSADVGLVYRTDARTSPTLAVAFEVPSGRGPPIVYPAAIVAGARHRDGARRFLDFLMGPEASRVFEEAGFIVLGAAPALRRQP